MDMDLSRMIERFKVWQASQTARRTALKQRLVHLEPLRADFVKRLLAVCALLLPIHVGLLRWAVGPIHGELWVFFLFTTVWPAAGLLVAFWCLRWGRRPWRIELATAMIFQSVVIAVTFGDALLTKYAGHGIPQYGALLILTILLSGFLIGEFFVGAWTLICCLSLQFAIHQSSGWIVNIGWSAAYVAAGWMSAQFARHFEKFFEASRTAEEQQRSAIVAERTHFAQQINDSLALGFSGIVLQLNAADEQLRTNPAEARANLDEARQLARRSLEEARRSVAALRANSPPREEG
jgi:signal transduction histidine kinase